MRGGEKVIDEFGGGGLKAKTKLLTTVGMKAQRNE